MSQTPQDPKRVQTRYRADPLIYAQIDFEKPDAVFKAKLIGLVVDGSYGGCQLALINTPQLQAGQTCRILMGSLTPTPLQAKVTWRKEVDTDLLKVGFQFI